MRQIKSIIVLSYSGIIKCLLDRKLIDTSKFYTVFYVTSGAITISLSERRAVVLAGSIFFKQPGDRLYFHGNREAEGYFCLFNFDYLITGSPYYSIDMLFPFYTSSYMHVNLNNTQSEIVRNCFEKIIDEEREDLIDKTQATILQLQMIILQSRRASKGYLRNGLSYFMHLN